VLACLTGAGLLGRMSVKRGQPPHEPTPASRNRVTVMAACGLSQDDIAAVIGISSPTVRRHYRRELDHAYSAIIARLAARLIAMADAGDERAIEFYLERQGGWVRSQAPGLNSTNAGPCRIVPSVSVT